MKKIFALVLALLCVMTCFVACNKNDDAKKNEETTTAATTTAATTEAEKPVLKMATNAYFQPYEYYDGDKIIGIDAEIAAAGAELKYEVGTMIEIPRACITADEVAKEADFFCFGTNDLTQYTLAADRQNYHIDEFIDPHHPAVLRLIETVCKNAHSCGKWVGICGELASDTGLTKMFLVFGVDELSVSPSQVLKIREVIRNLD